MSPSRSLDEALGAIVRLLIGLDIPYMVMGGLALSVWGRVRATQDVDLSIAVEPHRETEMVEALQAAHFLPATPRAIVGHRLLVCRYLKSTKGFPVEVDLFLARGEYQRRALDRAISIRVGRRRLRVIAPEDLILYKLLAARPIDHLDIRAVLEEQTGRLDQAYLARWRRQLGLTPRWRRLQNSP